MTSDPASNRIQRRAILKNGTLVLTAASLGSVLPGRCRSFATDPILENESPEVEGPSVSVGLVTDLHYADKVPAGTRHYRETLQKLDEAARQFERDEPDFPRGTWGLDRRGRFGRVGETISQDDQPRVLID